MVVSAILQLPSHLQLRVDSQAFMRAFEYGPVHAPISLEPWNLAPGWMRSLGPVPHPDAGLPLTLPLVSSNHLRHTALTDLREIERCHHNVNVLHPPFEVLSHQWQGRPAD
ncbi:MAG TPA: hypothetical protein VGO47_08480 [Chlamydiales bacterium]|nr:hypothetical protein [Chlamydiales bacterium]